MGALGSAGPTLQRRESSARLVRPNEPGLAGNRGFQFSTRARPRLTEGRDPIKVASATALRWTNFRLITTPLSLQARKSLSIIL